MDLRQLRYFVAVGDEGGVRAAGRLLHISQPQISHAVRALEGELGVQLMHRSPRGIRLTPEGEELVARGRDILKRVDGARGAIMGMADQPSATLRVGVVAGALSAGELLAPILREHRRSNPSVTVQLEDLAFGRQIEPLLDGTLDAAIVRLPISHPQLVVTPIAEEPRVVMVGTGHELANEESIDVGDLLGFATLPLDSPDDWADYWQLNDMRGGSNWNRETAPAATVPEAQLAVATNDVVITSPATLARLAPNPLTRAIELTGATPSVIAVVHGRDAGRVTRRFVKMAQEAAERHIDLLPGGSLPG